MSHKPHQKLNQFFATAICGNDILSSALYVSGIAILYSGLLAPVVLLCIAGVFLLYKAVYTEVVEALPINGGAYNCLLNGTSKVVAATAGITTFLSYVATAVISAVVAVEYLHTILHIPVIQSTVVLLLVFALLVISGVKDSAKVAGIIFVVHVLALVSFVVLGVIYYFTGVSHIQENLHHTVDIVTRQGGLLPALYLAFSASLLGVSGFESSANFVEEQDKGVFRKTLRNMLIGVAIFNPLIALVVLNAMPYGAIVAATDFLLADAARIVGGVPFQYFIVIDAFFVLSGAVLTSYVGVSGLMSRMAGDNCLPNFFAKANSKGSFSRIVITFFLLCTSILLLTKANIQSLAGVYTIAFLSVMCLFAFGNLILKETRTELKRTYSAPIIIVVLAFATTFMGIMGNIRIKVQNLVFFETYFLPSLLVVLAIIYQDYIMRFALRVTRRYPKIYNYLNERFNDMTEGRFAAFVHHPNRLYRILNYIDKNETGRNVHLICCQSGDKNNRKKNYEAIKEVLPYLVRAGMFSHLNVSVDYLNEEFGPGVIDKVSKEMKIRRNRILIGSIHNSHNFDYEELGGVRIVL